MKKTQHLHIFPFFKDKIYRFLLWIVCSMSLVQHVDAQLVITEVMQGNMNTLYNNGVNPESWIELYNPTDSIIFNFKEIYKLGTSPKYEESSKISHIWSVLPLCYVTITCDKEYGNVDFILDEDGGSVYLFNNEGNIVDSLSYPKMKKADVSWGRERDGEQCGHMLRPTPGGPNTDIVEEFPSKVQFSVEGGVWEHLDPFYVELTAKNVPDYYSEKRDVDTSLCIRYTLDGSEPTDSSQIYSEPVYVESTTCIRAKVFDETKPLLTSNSVSYINHGRPVDKNVVSIITDSLYFYGEEDGIMGNRIYAALGYRRPMNFEYFPLDNEQKALNLLCKGRAGGNTSRMGDPYLNFSFNAKKRYGEKHFKTEFWPNKKPYVNETKSAYLRCGNKKLCFMRDAVSLNMATYLDVDYQATDALSVYLNGKYYGFLYMYEKSNEDYVWSNYNKLEDIDFISIEGYQVAAVKAGTIDDFNLFKDFWQAAPHSLTEWRKWMDVDEYTNMMALELFSANVDFWYNNTRFFKSRVDSSSVWRWIANDFDHTFLKFFDTSYFEWALADDTRGLHKSDDYGSQLWRGLLESDEYKSYFLDRIIAYHGDFLNKRLYTACVDSIFNLIQQDVILTKQMYPDDYSAEWNRNYLIECIEKRSDYFHVDLQSFFKLGKAVNVKVNGLADSTMNLYYNNVKLKTNSFDGWDFEERTLSLQVKENADIVPVNWIVEKTIGGMIVTESYSRMDMLSYIIPSDVDSIVFSPSFSDFTNSVDDIKSPTDIELLKSGKLIIIWDMYGRQLYCSEKNKNLVLPKNVPLVIFVDGAIKKVMF